MQLHVKRSQQSAPKGFFGGDKGHTFKFECRLEMTPEEHELVVTYLWKDKSITTVKSEPDKEMSVPEILTVNKLLNGVSYSSKGITELEAIESSIIDGCKFLKLQTTALACYGGEQVIDIPDPRIELERARRASDVMPTQAESAAVVAATA